MIETDLHKHDLPRLENATQRQLEAAKVRFETGTGTQTDIAQSETQLRAAEADFARQQASLTELKYQIFVLSGVQVAEFESPLFKLPVGSNLSSFVDFVLSNDPQILALDAQIRAADIGQEIANRRNRGTVDVFVSSGYLNNINTDFSDNLDATASVSVRIPIYSGGVNKARRQQALAEKSITISQRRIAIENLSIQAQSIWTQKETADLVVASQRQRVVLAEQTLDRIRQGHKSGLRTLREVIEATFDVTSSQLSLAQAEAQQSLSTYQALVLLNAD